MALDTSLEKEIADDTKRGVSTDKLEFVRDQVRYIRDLNMRIEDAEEVVKKLRGEKKELEFNTLPNLFLENKITAISLAAEGNAPAYEAKLKDYFHANIRADWSPTQRQAGLDWLEKNKLSDIIKTCITIEIGRGQAKLTTKLLAILRAIKGLSFTVQQQAPWNTLTAALRERYQNGQPLKDSELELIGGTVGKIVSLQPKRE